MFSKKIKLAEKLIAQKKPEQGIATLLGFIVDLNAAMDYPQKKREQALAGKLLAHIFSIKNYRKILFQLIKSVPLSGTVFLIQEVVQYGQLNGAIAGLEEEYAIEKMPLTLFNLYLDVLDAFMARDKALDALHVYLETHPSMALGDLTTSVVLKSWDQNIEQPIKSQLVAEENDLELLAIFFKLVKLLYVEGRLIEAQAVINLLRPLAEMNTKLGETKIKNHNSYFVYLSQLLPLKKYPFPESLKTIYILGDSHTLSPSWENIQLNDQDYFIKPLLVTGCKIWHLRDSSTIHARINFNRAVERIPEGGTVIFILGEIDAREGLLSALEKKCYDSLAQAIQVLIDIYLKRILETIKTRKLDHLYVHQIPCVLNPTRLIVNQFNEQLERAITSLNHPKISWLGFPQLLLNPETFNSAFDLDETHLHPAYIQSEKVLK